MIIREFPQNQINDLSVAAYNLNLRSYFSKGMSIERKIKIFNSCHSRTSKNINSLL